MSKLTRQTLLQFAKDVNAAADIGKYGSGATGSPVYTNVIATIQALSAWTTGWAAETVANNRPFLEDMNAVDYVFGYMLCYIFQMGIPEWDADTTYYINSIVQYNGVCYQSLIDTNTNVTPIVGVSWKLLIPAISGILGTWVSKSATTIYQAATDGFVTAYADNTGSASTGIRVVTDSSATPTTVRDHSVIGANTGGTVSVQCVVKKNDYYEILLENGASLQGAYFIPIGS